MPISYNLTPLSASGHPATSLLYKLSSQGFPIVVRDPWSLQTIQEVIFQVPHVSTKTAEDIYFFRDEFVERVGRGFSFLLRTADAINFFGTRLCIYHLASVTKKNSCNRLICYSTAPPPGDNSPLLQYLLHQHFTDLPPTPDVNASANKYSAPVSMHFGTYIPRILQ